MLPKFRIHVEDDRIYIVDDEGFIAEDFATMDEAEDALAELENAEQEPEAGSSHIGRDLPLLILGAFVVWYLMPLGAL